MRTLSKSKKSLLAIGVVCACLMVAGLVLVAGCGKKEETKPPESGAELSVSAAFASTYAQKGYVILTAIWQWRGWLEERWITFSA